MKKFTLLALIAILASMTYQISGVTISISGVPVICPAPEALTAYRGWINALSGPGFPGLSQDPQTNFNAMSTANQNYQIIMNFLQKSSATASTVAGYGLGSYTCQSQAECIPLAALYLYQISVYLQWVLQTATLQPTQLENNSQTLSSIMNSLNNPNGFYIKNASGVQILNACAQAVLGRK